MRISLSSQLKKRYVAFIGKSLADGSPRRLHTLCNAHIIKNSLQQQADNAIFFQFVYKISSQL